MAGQHKSNPVNFRPGVLPGDPEGDRDWLYAHAEATGRTVGEVLSEVLAGYRARNEERRDDAAFRGHVLRWLREVRHVNAASVREIAGCTGSCLSTDNCYEQFGVDIEYTDKDGTVYTKAVEGEDMASLWSWVAGAWNGMPARAEEARPCAPEAGLALIRAERLRQVAAEGYTPEHDAEHGSGELAAAAAAYALAATGERDTSPALWPFGGGFKPGPKPLDSLVKAGALIAAEIDRIVAEESREPQQQGGA